MSLRGLSSARKVPDSQAGRQTTSLQHANTTTMSSVPWTMLTHSLHSLQVGNWREQGDFRYRQIGRTQIYPYFQPAADIAMSMWTLQTPYRPLAMPQAESPWCKRPTSNASCIQLCTRTDALIPSVCLWIHDRHEGMRMTKEALISGLMYSHMNLRLEQHLALRLGTVAQPDGVLKASRKIAFAPHHSIWHVRVVRSFLPVAFLAGLIPSRLRVTFQTQPDDLFTMGQRVERSHLNRCGQRIVVIRVDNVRGVMG